MGNNVLITGAAHGIGRAAAGYFSQNGYNVAVTCLNDISGIEELQKKLSASVKCLAYVGDIADSGCVSELFDLMEENGMLPDIVINNAGIAHIGLLQDMSDTEFRRIMDTNVTGMFNCSRAAIPHLVSKKSGRIINVSSMWGNVGASCEVAYSASKGAVNAFTKALAKELAPSNISVNAVAFGAVDTRMNAFLSDEEKKLLLEEIPMGRFCDVEEAGEILFKVATLPAYITGQIITADGGYT